MNRGLSGVDRLPRLSASLIILLAAATRFWRLDAHSIWFDEAVSLKWAGADIPYTWRVTMELVQEKHPPVYYVFLGLWQRALEWIGLGQNDAALRASGAALGVLTVLGLMVLAHRLSGRRTALLAGLFAALSPVLVWYSQELRMFQPATTTIVWSGTFLVCAWESEQVGRRLAWWAALCLAWLAALYSYLFSALALPAAAGSLLLLWWSDRTLQPQVARRRLVEGISAFAVVGLLFLPLALNAWSVNAAEGTPTTPFADVGETLRQLLTVFTVWRPPWPGWLVQASALLAAALALVGLLLPFAASRRPDRLWLTLWLGLPFLAGNLLLVTSDTIFGEDRYFLFLAPLLLWAAARGSIALWQRLGVAGLAGAALLATALAASLPTLWTPAMARENWRAAAALMTQHTFASRAMPAAAIAHVDYTHMPLEWYVRQQATFDDLAIFFPFGGTLEPGQVDSSVAPPLVGVAAAGYETLWLTQSHLEGVDDGRLVQGWLDSAYPLVTEAYPAGIVVRGYATRSDYAALPEGVVASPVELVPGLTLAACELTTPAVDARDVDIHPPSGWVHLRLWWQATAPIERDYRVRARLVGPEGVWGESLDREGSLMRMRPTSGWRPGGYLRDEVDINLNPETPPGSYPVVIRLLDGDGNDAGVETTCATAVITE